MGQRVGNFHGRDAYPSRHEAYEMNEPTERCQFSDEEIVRLINSDNMEEFELGANALLDAYGARMNTIISITCHQLLDIHTREDVYQETLKKIVKGLRNGYREEGKLSGYIGTLTRRTTTDAMRKQMRQPLAIPIGEAQEFLDDPTNLPQEDPAEHMLREEHLRTIRDTLNHLSMKNQEIIHLKFFEDLSNTEISKKLDMPVGTVGSRIWRVEERLRTLLPNSVKPKKHITKSCESKRPMT